MNNNEIIIRNRITKLNAEINDIDKEEKLLANLHEKLINFKETSSQFIPEISPIKRKLREGYNALKKEGFFINGINILNKKGQEAIDTSIEIEKNINNCNKAANNMIKKINTKRNNLYKIRQAKVSERSRLYQELNQIKGAI